MYIILTNLTPHSFFRMPFILNGKPFIALVKIIKESVYKGSFS